MKNRMLKFSIIGISLFIIVLSNFSMAKMNAVTFNPRGTIQTNAIYSSNYYAEGLELFPFRNTTIGIHAGFIGGTTNLPFDVGTIEYLSLQVLSLVIADQQIWRKYAQRRFWDVPDGGTLLLAFTGSVASAIEKGEAIKEMIESAYNISLSLVFGQFNRVEGITTLVYQGVLLTANIDDFTSKFTEYVSDDGFGEGITEEELDNSPIKAMEISLIRGRRLGDFVPITERPKLIPIFQTAWINPIGLVKTGSIIEFNLTRVIPDLTEIKGAENAIASYIVMKLPYVVDVKTIDPPTDNMYAHLKGEFEWIIKVDIPAWNINISRIYPDLYVKYDLNLTNLTHYPKILGEMSINSFPIDGSEDIIYDFYFENVGNEPAYNIKMAYSEFNLNQTHGLSLLVNNPELTFNGTKIMYYNLNNNTLTDTVLPLNESVVKITGWFYNNTAYDWLRNNQYVAPIEFSQMDKVMYVEENFLQIDEIDFTMENLTDESGTNTGYGTLTTTIPQLNPGENITKQFAVRNVPYGSFNEYVPVQLSQNEYQIILNNTYNWKELIIQYLIILGSTLHIPEDQVTWTNWFPGPVTGSAYYYEDIYGKQYAGLTNGLVIQIYDDEAVLIGKLSLDKDVYRFNEEVTFTLELTNIGNANATDIHYQLYHAFVSETYELQYVLPIPGANGTIPLIKPGETEIVEYSTNARTNVGLHPVVAVFGYTSMEEDDPTYDIFDNVTHPYVYSSLDYGIVLPPLDKQGTTKPTYPTPEVEVATTLIASGTINPGDIITLQVNITNTGDEATNIIYIQRLPPRLQYQEGSLGITIDGETVSDYTINVIPYQPDETKPRFNLGMPIVAIFDHPSKSGPYGIPLGVGESLIIEAQFKVTGKSSDYLYIPPAEVRYRSEFNMIQTSGVNNETRIPNEENPIPIFSGSSAMSNFGYSPIMSINAEVPTSDLVTTNSWGSYSASLSLVISQLSILGQYSLYIGLSIIFVTGVAILIYFKANGKHS